MFNISVLHNSNYQKIEDCSEGIIDNYSSGRVVIEYNNLPFLEQRYARLKDGVLLFFNAIPDFLEFGLTDFLVSEILEDGQQDESKVLRIEEFGDNIQLVFEGKNVLVGKNKFLINFFSELISYFTKMAKENEVESKIIVSRIEYYIDELEINI